MGKGLQDGERQGRGTQENCSATWLIVSGSLVMELVSGNLWIVVKDVKTLVVYDVE